MARRLAVVLILGGALGAGAPDKPPAPADPAALEFFEKDVRPVLVARCQTCHGGEKQKAALRLDSREAVLRGGETGPAAVPGKPDESLIVEAIHYDDALKMPPKSRLPDREIATLTRWIELGLPWPDQPAGRSAAGNSPPAFDLAARKAAHWSWQPVKPAAPPPVNDAAWPLGPEDRFILARLEAKGLRPAPEAKRPTLIRRLSFDLTGLPPTPAEVAAFVADDRADAYERVVDRLLGSARFGERWARHWLDLVRYAETHGHEFDPIIPNAWQYRDYVVRAFNADVPYDRFLTEHVAGDLVQPPRIDPTTGANESVLGTGFWFLGEEVHSPVDLRQDEADRLDNRLDVMTKTFLGLTVACARCHDHKFDAISQKDYYALSGFLISSNYRQVRFATAERERKAAEALQALLDGAREKVHRLAAAVVRHGVEGVPRALLAARSVLTGDHAAPADPSVRLWVEALTRARLDPQNPLHTFAAVACTPVTDSRDFRARLGAALDPDRGLGPWSPFGDEPRTATTLASFGDVADLTRLQNGHAFGPRSVAPGDLTVEGDASHPALGLFTKKAARRDPALAGLTLAEGTERDHGRLGTWDRAGQTLRSPELLLGSGTVYYLVKGAGRAYASVNSHVVVAGPLHAQVLTEWTDGGKGWRWVRHDLAAFAGHRTHIEFSPTEGGEFAVAQILQADRPPRFAEPPNRLLEAALAAAEADSPEALAAGYQALFQTLSRRLEGVGNDGRAGDEDTARLGDFVLRNPGLFAPADSAPAAALRAEASRLAGLHRALAASVAGPSPAAPAMMDGTGVDEHLLIRGSPRTPGPKVPRRFLEALTPGPTPLDPASGSGRLRLAAEMTADSDPFARRVIVNRVWHHLFGRGIVASVDNFGVLGEVPTHPELLDHLADRFVRDGWSLKRLVRSLVLTRSYRMSSAPDPTGDAADPGNHLLHRRDVRRLEAEPIRDAILAVSGRLDERVGGRSVAVHLTESMQGRGRPSRSGPADGDGRRSLYLGIRRNFLAPMMLAFDAPIPFNCVGRRNVSNVPAQALILMNDPFVAGQAALWADRLLADEPESPARRVALLYRSAFAREPDAAEVEGAVAFLKSQAEALGRSGDAWANDRPAWADLAHVMLNAKEFVFVD